jgi:hypothetical protein
MGARTRFFPWGVAGVVLSMVGLALVWGQVRALEGSPEEPGTPMATLNLNQTQMNSAHFDLSWNVIASGAETLSSAHFELSSTTGQPSTGLKNSPHNRICTGFWCGIVDFFLNSFLPIVMKQ